MNVVTSSVLRFIEFFGSTPFLYRSHSTVTPRTEAGESITIL